MLKFEYYYQEKTLYTQKPGEPRQPITKTFTTSWNSPGFILEPENHWITFTVYPQKIRVFYKEVESENPETHAPDLKWEEWVVSADTLVPQNQKITYYQKDLPKESPLIFTFTPQDQVEKIDGQWVKKNPNERK